MCQKNSGKKEENDCCPQGKTACPSILPILEFWETSFSDVLAERKWWKPLKPPSLRYIVVSCFQKASFVYFRFIGGYIRRYTPLKSGQFPPKVDEFRDLLKKRMEKKTAMSRATQN